MTTNHQPLHPSDNSTTNWQTNGPSFLCCHKTPGALNYPKLLSKKTYLFGAPFDGTTSFKPGARFAPTEIRLASDAIESYSPALNADLEDHYDKHLIYDLGDLPFNVEHDTFFNAVTRAARLINENNSKFLMMGGDHSITPHALRAVHERHPDLLLVQFDAHADLRNDFNGSKNSHASAMRRCLDFLAADQLLQVGIRSGTRAEFTEMRHNNRLIPPDAHALSQALAHKNGPIYVTLDIDIFDPSLVPGTGTQEAGGILWPQFAAMLDVLAKRHWISADIVELSPPNDPTGTSTLVAAKAVREMLLLLSKT